MNTIKTQLTCIALLLCIISLQLGSILRNTKAAQSAGNPPRTSVAAAKCLELVRKVATDRTAFGGPGAIGFLVKDGDLLDFVPFDQGSRFDLMKRTPKIIKAVDHNGEKFYTAVYEMEETHF